MKLWLSSLRKILNRPITDIVLMGVCAFLTTISIGYLLDLEGDYSTAWGMLSVFLFAGLYGFNFFMKKFILRTKDDSFKKRFWWSFVIGLFFALTFVYGYCLQYQGFGLPGFKGKLTMLMYALFLNGVAFPAFYFLFYYVERIKPFSLEKRENFHGKKIFFFSWLAIFVLWIPAFLAYYPCIMSFDFHQQVGWIELGHQCFSDHHPYLSTLEIELFYKWGKAIGSTQKGMSFLGIFHMILMSSALAYLTYTLSRLIPKKWMPIVSTLVLALYPFNPVLTLCTTKDVVFSVFFLWFVCLYTNYFVWKHTKASNIGYIIAILFTGIMMCSFRNNAVYALVAAGIVTFFFIPWKKKLFVVLSVVFISVGYEMSQNAIADYLGVKRSDASAEVHSVIMVTYGRVVDRHKDELPQDIHDTIAWYIPESAWNEYYPGISDAIKSAVKECTFDGHWKGQMKQVFKDWIEVGLHYPNEYLDAFLDLTRGYWFLDDVSFGTILGDGLEGRMGILYTYNSSKHEGMVDEIKHESKAPGIELMYEKIVSRNDCLRWPVFSLFFRLSFYMMGLFLLVLINLYRKDYKKLWLTMYPFLYFGTLLLGPIVQFRYAFPIMIVVPIFTALLFVKWEPHQKDEKILQEVVEN